MQCALRGALMTAELTSKTRLPNSDEGQHTNIMMQERMIHLSYVYWMLISIGQGTPSCSSKLSFIVLAVASPHSRSLAAVIC